LSEENGAENKTEEVGGEEGREGREEDEEEGEGEGRGEAEGEGGESGRASLFPLGSGLLSGVYLGLVNTWGWARIKDQMAMVFSRMRFSLLSFSLLHKNVPKRQDVRWCMRN